MSLPPGSLPIENSPDVDSGEFKILFGRKYKGKKIKEIHPAELEAYVGWLMLNTVRDGTWMYDETMKLIKAAQKYRVEQDEKRVVKL